MGPQQDPGHLSVPEDDDSRDSRVSEVSNLALMGSVEHAESSGSGSSSSSQGDLEFKSFSKFPLRRNPFPNREQALVQLDAMAALSPTQFGFSVMGQDAPEVRGVNSQVVVIANVNKESVAYKQGLRNGNWIHNINNINVMSAKENQGDKQKKSMVLQVSALLISRHTTRISIRISREKKTAARKTAQAAAATQDAPRTARSGSSAAGSEGSSTVVASGSTASGSGSRAASGDTDSQSRSRSRTPTTPQHHQHQRHQRHQLQHPEQHRRLVTSDPGWVLQPRSSSEAVLSGSPRKQTYDTISKAPDGRTSIASGQSSSHGSLHSTASSGANAGAHSSNYTSFRQPARSSDYTSFQHGSRRQVTGTRGSLSAEAVSPPASLFAGDEVRVCEHCCATLRTATAQYGQSNR
eukprot:m.327292 g.327292  ORF g.327292 m.327292 type:complete len:408 (+) comp19748_c3_seq4:641-1864(+)